ncbi:MAG: thiamine pyrophosphate-dependent dehydrogenase E1 component subunit alpha [Elusimicrobia bacterium]|nr:thiamine pyrophosphate-dependent dehydrogenase E1 component subunit alpha [Elusimicrobiota bacterium]MBU2614631.1 thiamine pyrophosphate-dependent dehydrogenase E1 component subunit alpha [Elusimicrobiota bacterium]
MMEIRQFEDKIMDLLAKNIAEGGSHLYAGEEAVAVGSMAAINPEDLITSTHRGHGHCIAKGGKLPELMAEILGKKTGCCKGKGGSLHLADVSTGNLGANGVVGGGFGMATGAGLSIKIRKTNQVVLCFFGDGATNQGIFHESLNMAGVWKLPVIYICENNLYGMSVSVKRASAVEDLAKKAVPYAMPSEHVDGMDILAVKDVVSKYAKYAREGKGPSLIVCSTYRYYGHSRSDPRVYRTKEEEKFWKEKDCILSFSRKLEQAKILTREEIDAIEKEVNKEIEEATKFAIESPLPEPEALYEDLYV